MSVLYPDLHVFLFASTRWCLWRIWSWKRLWLRRMCWPARRPSTTWWTWRERTTLCLFPLWGPEGKAPKGVLFYFRLKAFFKFERLHCWLYCLTVSPCLAQRWTVSHHVERAWNAGQNPRWGHGSTPARAGLHRGVPQQARRGRGQKEEGPEEGGPGGQDGKEQQQGCRGQKLAGLREVRFGLV